MVRRTILCALLQRSASHTRRQVRGAATMGVVVDQVVVDKKARMEELERRAKMGRRRRLDPSKAVMDRRDEAAAKILAAPGREAQLLPQQLVCRPEADGPLRLITQNPRDDLVDVGTCFHRYRASELRQPAASMRFLAHVAALSKTTYGRAWPPHCSRRHFC